MGTKNHEGYADPTAAMAMASAMKEYRQNQRKIWARNNAIRSRPKVYAVSPYAGDIENNIQTAIRFCRYIIANDRICIASHLLYPQILNDTDPEERELGLQYGLALLAACDEVWVLSDDPADISSGMAGEIHEAKRLKKKIRYVSREVIG